MNQIFVSTEEGMAEPSWLEKIEPFAQKVVEAAGYDDEEFSIMFCSDAMIQKLNSDYRHIDSPTDVLSFENGEEYTDEEGKTWFQAGDIAISVDTLPKNAEYFEVSQNEELKRLIIHGILHLNGYDHGEEHVEKGVEPVCEMLVLQKKLMEQFENYELI
ncbi:MAG: rRNA maturation RNase YbeY [Treponema sp.]|nr:rRNA maturation RNase YbeY [Spirochaetia bacterium]MDD7459067.1 rRNA maturation RNase YbeY [Spirochaetales bacterium]MDY5811812.1 rRNA maturation RNase YbeY [Treponema sp.]MEE1182508.1 rRNA maturation RNase YbeY [Treponema sp.]